MNLHETIERPERVVLVGVHTGCRNELEDSTEESMRELELLAETAGAEVVAHFVQNRPAVDNATYVGEGKAEEICEFCENNEIDIVICDDELSGSQVRNLEDLVKTRVMDRSALIMDIFASRARTKEGKLQVELAQLQYYLTRLTGSFVNLSRLGGGIGTRGPGETKLETDRRHIRNRISVIRKQLDEVEKNRENQRKQRIKEGMQQIALVGYTNAGKSSLLNYLTDAGVLAEDKLFATLDPTARKLTLPDGSPVVLVDTVGFIRKLPHHLIKAFHSTLEEAVIADVLVHVVDASSPQLDQNTEVVETLLTELGAAQKPIVTAFNKADLLQEFIPKKQMSVDISAKTGYNVDRLLDMLCEAMPEKRHRVKVLIPYDKGSLISVIYKNANINSEEHTADGTLMDITADHKTFNLVSDYIV
ncbi:MAG: GTPase HflX [Clostridia bacterium]|nr:GTPase HflX [Clostridia bacterium]